MEQDNSHQTTPLSDLIVSAPLFHGPKESSLTNTDVTQLHMQASKQGLEPLAEALQKQPVADLICATMQGSPYLTALIRNDLARLQRVICSPPAAHFNELISKLNEDVRQSTTIEAAMKTLRVFKNEVALQLALADVGGVCPVMTVTHKLTETAQTALTVAVKFLFQNAIVKGDWLAAQDLDGRYDPAATSGYIVLGMGKLGGYELNYSSDIDLIVFYDPQKARLRDSLEVQKFFVKLTRDLVRLMDERTADGYVFRTDLRLRPDPGATQIALSVDAAAVYYESFGQNWERAALIKARPVAGDLGSAAAVLAELQPFVWRKYLDFAAIMDIHAMKRQIHSFHGFGDIQVSGHNIKLGRGGIREIEFFVQTQQLIAGGRQRDLRKNKTLETLDGLVDLNWIKPEVRDELKEAYTFLRTIEHRLQMVRDEQTQQMPSDPETLESFAKFCGYESTSKLSDALLPVLKCVQTHFDALFKDDNQDEGGAGNLVFAGQDDDPATIKALSGMGFSRPDYIISTVRSWHHGRYAAVRSAPSRERLTAVQGALLEALSETADPDNAFSSFDRFLAELPTGVQLFALLHSKPGLMRLVADIMGSAPRLASILSRRRRLLDAVIDPRTFDETPSKPVLTNLVEEELARAASFEEVLDTARVIGGEQAFLLGVRVLSGTINADQAGAAFAVLATSIISVLLERAAQEMAKSAGVVPRGGAVVIAMGKLGGRELTASSDVDLIVVYDYPENETASNGPSPLSPSQYFTRLTQRLITALGAPTAQGTLYEVDMRLRPSGQQGPVATQLSSFIRYQASEAWTWEQMALVRARTVAGPPQLRERVEQAIKAALLHPRDPAKIATDVRDMRARIEKEKGTDNIWDLKQVRGGLVDMEFIAQYLQLIHAHDHPEILDQNTLRAFHNLRQANLLEARHADVLIPAANLVHNLTQVLRICIEDKFDPLSAPQGLKELLARAGAAPSFELLQENLRQTLSESAAIFNEVISPSVKKTLA